MEKRCFLKNPIVMSGLLFSSFIPNLYAAPEQEQKSMVLPMIQVIGSQEDAVSKIPGAAVIETKSKLNKLFRHLQKIS